MKRTPPEALENLIVSVRSGSKYRDVDTDLVRLIGARELANRRDEREAIKATKNKLHQVGGAYFTSTPRYEQWTYDLLLAAGDPDALKGVCSRIMRTHASTAERLPILSEFYEEIFQNLPPVQSVIDVACGLNPLAIPWMPLQELALYRAYDIFGSMISFLNKFFAIAGVNGIAEVRDALNYVPAQEFDVALVLKTVPCLDQLDRTASLRLLRGLNARFMIVSFPVKSLGGRNKGMTKTYEVAFQSLIQNEQWRTTKMEFATELVFIVEK